jgi:hypothetical protein
MCNLYTLIEEAREIIEAGGQLVNLSRLADNLKLHEVGLKMIVEETAKAASLLEHLQGHSGPFHRDKPSWLRSRRRLRAY